MRRLRREQRQERRRARRQERRRVEADPEVAPPVPWRWREGSTSDGETSGFRMVVVLGNPNGHRYMQLTGPPLPPGFEHELPVDNTDREDAITPMAEQPEIPPGFARDEGEFQEDAQPHVEEEAPRVEPATAMEDLPSDYLPEPDDWSPGDMA